jgi:hypothetical protein
MISAYPDNTVAIKSEQMIETLTEMANEDVKNDVGHMSKNEVISLLRG